MQFRLHKPFEPTGDQPAAIKQLIEGVEQAREHQVLLGVTGSGKTFTMANVVQATQLPTLVIAHNKTLAAQLYQEFRDFFPENAVSYFVSYYDYYQPEAYMPSTDTYIEKEAQINDEIDKLRLAATTNLLTRRDVIVVASVSCIYNLGSPVEYSENSLRLIEGEVIQRQTLLLQLANLQYQRNDVDLRRGTFRVRGERIQVWPAYENHALTIETLENRITKLDWIDPVSGDVLPWSEQNRTELPDGPLVTDIPPEAAPRTRRVTVYPAKHYLLQEKDQTLIYQEIEQDLQERLAVLRADGKIVEAYRLEAKVHHDLEQLRELGYVNGIENYSRYFDGRQPGDAPFSLLEHFRANAKRFTNGQYLTFVDESHITLPQVRGMYFGDLSRKQTLIEYGFRLPSALDNRPLRFPEFQERLDKTVYVSATPDEYEISLAGNKVVEQLIRPTGLVDPQIIIRPTLQQVEDLVLEVLTRLSRGQRTLVTTLTKRMAEDLTEYLNDPEKIKILVNRARERAEQYRDQANPEAVVLTDQIKTILELPIGKIPAEILDAAMVRTLEELPDPEHLTFPKVAYLHADVETLERSDILADLRRGNYDIVVGINLLREGLDLPEVSLVAILDADKEGFLRSKTSLIQTIGRAARHEEGAVILYADYLTKSMKAAIEETQRRRQIQIDYNQTHGITPHSIAKPIRDRMVEKTELVEDAVTAAVGNLKINLNKTEQIDLAQIDPTALTPSEKKQLSAKLRRRMLQAAKAMDFELATVLRDTIAGLNS